MPAKKKVKAYAQAGVDIDLGDRVKGDLKESLLGASRPEVMGSVGGFGGLFDLSKSKYIIAYIHGMRRVLILTNE